MKLSIIIACYNGEKFIGRQLDSLANQKYKGPWEVIISDNGSTDNSLDIVRAYMDRIPELRIIDSSDGRGRAYARNIGAEAASGDAILFLDQDDEVAQGWLAAMGEALLRHDFVACRIDAEKLNEPWMQKSRGYPQKDGLQEYKYPPFLPHAMGCTLGIRKTLHEAVGGLDETYSTLDDTDYCWRIQLAGTRLNFVPNAVLHYRYRSRLKDIFRQGLEYSEENVKIYKNYLHLGMPKLEWKAGVNKWRLLVKLSFKIRDKGDMAKCLFLLGWRLGRVRGSVKYRICAF